ncbi:hypothetical protein DOTSEDRAFT_74787 [Dothistroma septosporum NZE10]|uniref:Galactose oxidase n=1 Tax=Dothistroma septosporum (strain NZE10 / CBS 128990) TaxID=675120 RepID=N1PC76_DOTSN|nr:hypothetical protein DOTSEDRAFT_74787 [Dothistroma septosporum NZE10]
MVAKPTMPLKANFKQIVTTQHDGTRLSLVRSNNTITAVGHRAYIFGGELPDGKLAGNEVHSINLQHTENTEEPESAYSILPAVADEIDGNGVPPPRTKHAASHLNICVAVFGGVDESGKLVDQDPTLWLYVTAKSAWQRFDAEGSSIAPVQRSDAKLFEHNNSLILYGGLDAQRQQLKDVWHFNYSSRKWTPLPSAPVSTLNAALVDGTLYLIHSTESMSSDVHTLDTTTAKSEWQTRSFPINPLAPGPRPRVGGGLVPISTGYGRNYLLYFFGARENPTTHETQAPDETEEPTQWSDLWTYQVGSSKPEAKATTSLADAIKPAAIKDAIRSKLGYDTGSHSWAEVEVLPPENLPDGEGKVHPGPRAYFGYDVAGEGHQIVIFGGSNAKGEREGDGWLITFS